MVGVGTAARVASWVEFLAPKMWGPGRPVFGGPARLVLTVRFRLQCR